MNNIISDSVSEENKPIGIQREEAITKGYQDAVDMLRTLMKETRNENLSVRDVGHHLGNVLCSVSGDEDFGVTGLDEGEHLIATFNTCNTNIMNMNNEDRLQALQDITTISGLYKTASNDNQFQGCHQLLEKIFMLAGVDINTEISQKTITFFSKYENNA